MNKIIKYKQVNLPFKVWIILAIFSFLMFLFFGMYSIKDYIYTSRYIKVEAIITNVWTSSSSYDDTYSIYRDFTYQYDGNNYSGTQEVLLGSQVDKKINIYIDPENPSKYKNTYISNVTIGMTLFFGIVTLFVVSSCAKKLKIEKEKNELTNLLKHQYHNIK